jgi:hypothetical protein
MTRATWRFPIRAAWLAAVALAGNGQSGDDETSEITSDTWDGTPAHPFGLATPGTVPPQLLR